MKQRGDNVTAMSENLINKCTVSIGFIGLGLMGSRLTRRLHSSGWNIQAWNRSPDPAKSLARDGVVISSSIATLVADSEVILSCLANDAAVHSVYFDSGGVFSSAKPGTVILEMSTISPELSHLLHREASTRGVDLLDLAVSGSTPAVEQEPSHYSPVATRAPSGNAPPSMSPSRNNGS
jgi:3-hydroxyisobutyrate dehydrogenase